MWICNSCGSKEVYHKNFSIELSKCDKDGIEGRVEDEKVFSSYICDECDNSSVYSINDIAYWEGIEDKDCIL